jgi:hypothetical protein
MTRRDYVQVANVLRSQKPKARGYKLTAWLEIVGAFSGYFASTNPFFDTYKFMKACGV